VVGISDLTAIHIAARATNRVIGQKQRTEPNIGECKVLARLLLQICGLPQCWNWQGITELNRGVPGRSRYPRHPRSTRYRNGEATTCPISPWISRGTCNGGNA